MLVYLRKPLPGYARHALGQIELIDKKIFQLLQRTASAGIRRSGGSRPLDNQVDGVLAHDEVVGLCAPLQASRGAPAEPERVTQKRGRGQPGDDDEGDGNPTPKKFMKELKSDVKNMVQSMLASAGVRGGGNSSSGSGGGGKGKPKGKPKGAGRGGSGERSSVRMPSLLIGCTPEDDDRNPICFGFNLPQGCDKAPPGGKCNKGRHVCCKKGCFQNHPYVATHG